MVNNEQLKELLVNAFENYAIKLLKSSADELNLDNLSVWSKLFGLEFRSALDIYDVQ